MEGLVDGVEQDLPKMLLQDCPCQTEEGLIDRSPPDVVSPKEDELKR